MRFDTPLVEGVLIRRYKRFLADVLLADGSQLTAHTSNTGAMSTCSDPGARVWLRNTGNPQRKYPYSWELVETASGELVGINTGLSNTLVREGIENGTIKELQGYRKIRPEVRYGLENSRIDLLLEASQGPDCFVEVKNVTLIEAGSATALFPDAVSTRGARHLRELMAMVQQGYRAVIFFCVQRTDARVVSPADAIDPVYGQSLRRALAQGVEGLAYSARVSTRGIRLQQCLPVICD